MTNGAADNGPERLIRQNRVLELIATGASLTETLTELITFVEAEAPGTRCGILIVTDDGAHFRRGVGPRLPEAYHAALDGIPITPPYAGPCGEAAHANTSVVVPDIAHDRHYAEAWRNVVLSSGLAAVCSTPVRAADGRALASFAMYYDRPQGPMPAYPGPIAAATRLAAMVLQHDRALREAERRFRDVLGALPAAVYTTDRAGRIAYYNQAAAAIAGRAPEVGSGGWCVFCRCHCPDQRPAAHEQCPMEACLREDRAFAGIEIAAVRPDGSPLPLLAYITPLHDASGALSGAVSMLVDISERKRIEVEHQRIRSIVEHSDDAIVSKDLDGIVTSWNGGAERLFGYKAAEIVGKSIMLLIPPDRADEEMHILATVRRGEHIEHLETVRRRKDGSLVPVSETISPVADTRGRVIGASKIARNITERKRAEAAIQKSEERLRLLNEGLESRVQEEIAAREAAQVRLRLAERVEALGQLAGGIAHDFNNVLQSISSGVRLLGRRANDPETVRELVRALSEATERGASVTRRLLTFARRAELQTEPVNAARLLADLREILAPTLGGGIAIRIEAPADLALNADKAQLETALVNLATNARDAMPAGGTLTLSAASDGVAEGGALGASLKPGAYVRFQVRDDGAGMEPAVLARASEPFFTTKPPGQGTGLGLAGARGFAEQSGGGFAITSAPGRGTAVTLWLPAANATQSAQPERRAIPFARRSANLRLLLVDDDRIVCAALGRELQEEGCMAVLAASAAEALALLERGEAIDLIVSDFAMPGMDGIALIREARRRRPRLPAILLTGIAAIPGGEALEIAFDGAIALMRKPVSAGALVGRAAELLQHDLRLAGQDAA